MQWLQAIRKFFPQHKYAINAKLLGDHAQLAWSNLGYWDQHTSSYPQACRQLADQLAQATGLTATDHLLDLGCGQGASLWHWAQQYKVAHFAAVELQPACVAAIQQQLIPGLDAIYAASFLDLAALSLPETFDVVRCIDAAYHHSLEQFLAAVTPILKSQGRLGFHYLIRSARWATLTPWQQRKYHYLLKSADVELNHVYDETTTRQILAAQGLTNIQIRCLSAEVLAGFAAYIAQQSYSHVHAAMLDQLKIQMTAKLCAKLYRDGLIEYVQITAHKK